MKFNEDVILKQDAPVAPVMTKVDSTPCTATPTTVSGLVAKPEDSPVYAAALAFCNSFPAEKNGSMCDSLRKAENEKLCDARSQDGDGRRDGVSVQVL